MFRILMQSKFVCGKNKYYIFETEEKGKRYTFHVTETLVGPVAITVTSVGGADGAKNKVRKIKKQYKNYINNYIILIYTSTCCKTFNY